MSRLAIFILRVLIVVTALVALFGQLVAIPGLIRETIRWEPDLLRLAIPYGIAAIAAILCVEIALVALWLLLSKVRRGAIFSESAFRWVDVIICSAAVATALCLAVAVWHLGVERIGPPGLMLVLVCSVIGGTAFVLLVIVMRGLLKQATALETELAEVV